MRLVRSSIFLFVIIIIITIILFSSGLFVYHPTIHPFIIHPSIHPYIHPGSRFMIHMDSLDQRMCTNSLFLCTCHIQWDRQHSLSDRWKHDWRWTFPLSDDAKLTITFNNTGIWGFDYRTKSPKMSCSVVFYLSMYLLFMVLWIFRVEGAKNNTLRKQVKRCIKMQNNIANTWITKLPAKINVIN